jgi:hypothetical protein
MRGRAGASAAGHGAGAGEGSGGGVGSRKWPAADAPARFSSPMALTAALWGPGVVPLGRSPRRPPLRRVGSGFGARVDKLAKSALLNGS